MVQEQSTRLWEMEALDPCPPGYLGCVEEDGVLICTGNRAVFQQFPPPHLSVYDLWRSAHVSRHR